MSPTPLPFRHPHPTPPHPPNAAVSLKSLSHRRRNLAAPPTPRPPQLLRLPTSPARRRLRRSTPTPSRRSVSAHSVILDIGFEPLKFKQTSEHEQSAPLLIFDIETTGFFQKKTTGNFQKDNRITEFAVRDLCGGKDSTFETLINPERGVPGYLKTVNNINTELVCKPDVPRFSDVLPLLLAFVRSRQTPGKPVIWVAHKVNTFDGPFLAQEFNRCSAQMPEDWLFVDSFCLARKLLLEASEEAGKRNGDTIM
ncbi:hypothetical protein ZWY2020_013213 [Hordeum vulgare]|nr:hypothetical protein ZWY2020_013213 [Hordeum vulgare]